MRPRFKPPMNRRYFHTKRKIDDKDIVLIKKKVEKLKRKKINNLHKGKIKRFKL